jgi:hypothetical protein
MLERKYVKQNTKLKFNKMKENIDFYRENFISLNDL